MEMVPLLKTVMAMKPKTVSPRALPGDRAEGDDDRPRPPADPDLLAGRAGAADHLAAGGDPGAQAGEAAADDFNLGIYRMQVTGRNTTLMRWLKHRGGAQHHRPLEGGAAASRCRPPPSSAPIPAPSWRR